MQNVIVLVAHKLIVLILALKLDLRIPLRVERLADVLENAILVNLKIDESSAVARAGRGTWRVVDVIVIRVPEYGRRRSQFEMVSVLGAVLYLRCAQSCPSKA